MIAWRSCQRGALTFCGVLEAVQLIQAFSVHVSTLAGQDSVISFLEAENSQENLGRISPSYDDLGLWEIVRHMRRSQGQQMTARHPGNQSQVMGPVTEKKLHNGGRALVTLTFPLLHFIRAPKPILAL